VLQHFPQIAEAMLKRHWTFVNHGFYNTRYLTTFSAAQERELLHSCGDTFARLTGRELHVIGRPHRIKYLGAVLDYIMSHERVWQATTDEIAAYYLAHAPPPAQGQQRIAVKASLSSRFRNASPSLRRSCISSGHFIASGSSTINHT
jgi:hypothetical protein